MMHDENVLHPRGRNELMGCVPWSARKAIFFFSFFFFCRCILLKDGAGRG